MVRFPGAWRALSALAARRLDPASGLRRKLVVRNAVSGWDAASRRDYQLMLVRYAPDVEWDFDPELEGLGLSGTYRGHAGAVKLIEAFGEAWENWALSLDAVIDLGDDRGLALGTFHLPATVSGLQMDREFAILITARDGLVAREQDFFGWDRALRAAGVDPAAVDLPRRHHAAPARAAGPARS